MKAPKLNKALLNVEIEYTHDFEYYDAVSQTYDFSHAMQNNKPVSL